MTDLVHDHVLDDGLHEGLGLRAVGRDVAARLEHVHREVHLLRRGVAVVAVGGELVAVLPAQAELGQLVLAGLRAAHVFNQEAARTACEDVAHADVGVEDFATARVGVAGADGEADVGADEPANRRMASVHIVPMGVIGLLLGDHGVLETDLLEGLVPLGDAGLDRAAIARRNVLVHPVDDRLHRLGQRRRRVLLLEAPARQHVHARVGLQVRVQVGVGLHEVAEARVDRAARHRGLGQGAEVVDVADEEAARVRRGLGRRRAGHRRGHQRRRRDARRGEVHARRQRAELVVGTRCGEEGIGLVGRIGQAVGCLQARAVAGDVGQQEAGVDQEALALGVVGAGDGRGPQQAGREGLFDGRLALAGGAELVVQRDQLQLAADQAELGHGVRPHLAGVGAALADAVGDVDGEQEGLVQQRARHLDEDLLVLAPDREQALHGLEVLADVGEGLERGGIGGRLGRGGGCGGGRRRAVLGRVLRHGGQGQQRQRECGQGGLEHGRSSSGSMG